MRGAAYAAIALTLIIACPIMLGYGLASETHEVERDVTSPGGSLSEAILNSQTPYFLDYAGPNNNNLLIREISAEGSGWEGTIISPDFVSVSETVTTEPIYNTGAGEMALGEVTDATYSGGTGQQAYVPASSPVHTHYGYDVPVTTTYAVATDGSYFGSTYTYIEAQPYMDFQISGSYSVIVGSYGGYQQTISSTGALKIIRTATASQTAGLYNLIAVLSDDAQYSGNYVMITHNGLGLDLYTSQLDTVPHTDGYEATVPSGTPGVLVIDGTYHPLDNETSDTKIVYDAPDLVWMTSTGDAIDSGVNVKLAVGRGQQILLATAAAGFGAGSVPAGTTQLPSFDYGFLYTTGVTATLQTASGSVQITPQAAGGFTALRDGDSWKLVLSDSTVIDSPYFVVYLSTGTLHLAYRDVAALTNDHGIWTADMNGEGVVRISETGGTDSYHAYAAIYRITWSYGTVSIVADSGVDTYSSVSSIALALSRANTSIDYTYQLDITSYANVAYGWTIPAGTGIYQTEWMNGYANGYLRIMAEVGPGQDLYIYAERPTGDTSTPIARVMNTAGTMGAEVAVTMNGETSSMAATVGSYTYCMIELDGIEHTVTVTGLIDGWPAMGTVPVKFNSISGTSDILGTEAGGTFTHIYLANIGTPVKLRVDAASIVGGYFPSTKDCSLDVFALYPGDDRQTVAVDSVGVFGDSLSIGGRAYTIDTGRLYYGDVDLGPLRTLVIDMTRNGGSYNITVGEESYEATTPAIVFGGEWSLTLHRSVTVTEMATATSWVPGEFALDTDGFVLVMIMAAVGAFVALGMTGARSGAKVGLLALICGSAAAVGLIIL